MTFNWRRAGQIAALVFVALFVMRFVAQSSTSPADFVPAFNDVAQTGSDQFENSRKNYASTKSIGGLQKPADAGIGQASPESQKYEKIGSLMQSTNDYDVDRRRVDELVTSMQGIIQLERAVGLKGGRVVQLGIGVPPDKFDAFIEGSRVIGRTLSVEIIKNDKTNEYLQLRAKRETLAKARAALEEIKAGGGSIDERVNVQTKLTDVEQQIQDLGVSLGEFDSQNELCTVKLTLREVRAPRAVSMARRALHAFEAAVLDYLMLGLGFFGLMAGGWIALAAFDKLRRMMAASGAP